MADWIDDWIAAPVCMHVVCLRCGILAHAKTLDEALAIGGEHARDGAAVYLTPGGPSAGAPGNPVIWIH